MLTRVAGDLLSGALEITSGGGGIHALEVSIESPVAVVLQRIGVVAGAAHVNRPTIHLPLVGIRPTHPVQGALQRGVGDIGHGYAPHKRRRIQSPLPRPTPIVVQLQLLV